jgi:hypothetical protein
MDERNEVVRAALREIVPVAEEPSRQLQVRRAA